MIRSRLYNPVVKAVSYDAEAKTLIVEFTRGSVVKHAPVPYEIYLALVNARFPEKIYNHQVMGVIPLITGE